MKVPTLLADISALVKPDQTQVAVRLAVVTSYSPGSVNVGIKIGGSTTEVIGRFLNYKPVVGDTVQVIQDGLDPIVIGRVGTSGSGLTIPVGLVAMWGNDTPDDWERCEGQSTSGNDALSKVWGANVPDLRYMFVRGAGPGVGVGARGGNDKVALNINHLPSHTHTTESFPSGREVGGYGLTTTSGFQDRVEVLSGGGGGTGVAGQGQAFETLPPYYVVTFIVKVA